METDWKLYELQATASLPTQSNIVVACSAIRLGERCSLKEAYALAVNALKVLEIERDEVGVFAGMDLVEIHNLLI